MKKITIYFGPKSGFEKIIPDERKTLSELVAEDDAKRKVFTHIFKKDEEIALKQEVIEKIHLNNLIAYSESYSGITESAVQGFASIFSGYDIDYLYLQNPPIQIQHQLEQTYPKMITIKKYNYKKLSKNMFLKINLKFDDFIIGQNKVKKRLLVSLYPLMSDNNNHKPVVMMFYGKSGIGKTETAKFISKILGQNLFRKQFSMFHSGEFQGYIFGGNHSQGCFARDLLERESNVILLDEFDKPHPVFHSAFYQLFDEGIFEDKNYRVELFDSIIICTSNYQNEAEIRKHLGDPIFFRFDKFIHFEDLSEDSLKQIITMLITNKYKNLSKAEKKMVDKDYIQKRLFDNVSRLTNVRQIANIVDEYYGIQLVDKILEGKING
jgi:ATP-dependent Clp protease ATP-binding subunit ClpA